MSQGVTVARAEGSPLLGDSYLTSGEAKEAGRRKAQVWRQALGYDGKGVSGGWGTRPDHRVSRSPRGGASSRPGLGLLLCECRYRSGWGEPAFLVSEFQQVTWLCRSQGCRGRACCPFPGLRRW